MHLLLSAGGEMDLDLISHRYGGLNFIKITQLKFQCVSSTPLHSHPILHLHSFVYLYIIFADWKKHMLELILSGILVISMQFKLFCFQMFTCFCAFFFLEIHHTSCKCVNFWGIVCTVLHKVSQQNWYFCQESQFELNNLLPLVRILMCWEAYQYNSTNVLVMVLEERYSRIPESASGQFHDILWKPKTIDKGEPGIQHTKGWDQSG